MNYKSIKKMILNGEVPTPQQFEAAIRDQQVAVLTYANSMAKHAAKLLAARHHPFPLPEDQEGRVMRRAVQFEVEHERLCRLHLWREVSAHAPQTAEPGVGSA